MIIRPRPELSACEILFFMFWMKYNGLFISFFLFQTKLSLKKKIKAGAFVTKRQVLLTVLNKTQPSQKKFREWILYCTIAPNN